MSSTLSVVYLVAYFPRLSSRETANAENNQESNTSGRGVRGSFQATVA